MPTLTDSKFDALRTQGFTGSISDMTLQWLKANGATSNAVPDAWGEMLALYLKTPQRNSGWYELLGDEGYTGSMNDRELQFWLAGGVLSPPTINP